MSVKTSTWVWHHSQATHSARLVLLALADYAHDDGGNAFPSVTTLTKKTKLSRRAVQVALRDLEEMGEIRKTGIHASGTNIYRINTGHGANDAPRDASREEGCADPSTGGADKSAPGADLSTMGAELALDGRTPCAQTIKEPLEEPIGGEALETHHAPTSEPADNTVDNTSINTSGVESTPPPSKRRSQRRSQMPSQRREIAPEEDLLALLDDNPAVAPVRGINRRPAQRNPDRTLKLPPIPVDD